MKPENYPPTTIYDGETGYLLEWDKQSAVRVRPYKYNCQPTNKNDPKSGNWFFPSALSFLSHPLLAHLTPDQVQELLARNLVSFLEYTTLLEHRIVNRSVEHIVHNCLPVAVPHGMCMDALRIYTDEGYHAVMSADVAHQVSEIFGISQTTRQFSRISRLEALASGFQQQALGWFLIGFVSETAITKEFAKMGRSALVPAVHSMLMDHLSDEWKHSRCFVRMFSYLWPRLTRPEREFCATQLPVIIQECFRLDESLLERDLAALGLDSNVAQTISAERNNETANRLRAKNGASATLHALRECAFFSEPRYVANFAKHGLIDPAG
ncbi:diiron oxygenase [Cupriavidus consociatus]|uniref:diiron oxygenase n=1 Tax=Cupriavidus consociatus TaxID=2821357 RepID=UPI001AE6B9A3|nr:MULTISPECIES: diiron oxygenase [unclassified Cupriavidus]MBP0619148.1 diiron oxygenase [Cupriavidus sp. LEh25]MDK2655793.1 diiron oxygenase [Cupriavidus sp. LEh21]